VVRNKRPRGRATPHKPRACNQARIHAAEWKEKRRRRRPAQRWSSVPDRYV